MNSRYDIYAEIIIEAKSGTLTQLILCKVLLADKFNSTTPNLIGLFKYQWSQIIIFGKWWDEMDVLILEMKKPGNCIQNTWIHVEPIFSSSFKRDKTYSCSYVFHKVNTNEKDAAVFKMSKTIKRILQHWLCFKIDIYHVQDVLYKFK